MTGELMYNALAIPSLWRSPPDNFAPPSPKGLFSFSGKRFITELREALLIAFTNLFSSISL